VWKPTIAYAITERFVGKVTGAWIDVRPDQSSFPSGDPL
jgi:hypothetical protein